MSKPPKRPTQNPGPSGRRPTGSAGAPRQSGVDRAVALRDVMEHVVSVEQENRRRTGPRSSRGRVVLLAVVCVALLGASVYSWVARPEFIWGPQRHADTPQRADASARTELFLLSRRIEAYRAANGAYPRDLAALGRGGAGSGITYELLSDSLYRLRARTTTGDLTYQSDESPEQFVGGAMRTLGGTRPHP